jgi:hypothetical protein
MNPFRNLNVKLVDGFFICQSPMNQCVRECLGCTSSRTGLVCLLAVKACTAVTLEAQRTVERILDPDCPVRDLAESLDSNGLKVA